MDTLLGGVVFAAVLVAHFFAVVAVQAEGIGPHALHGPGTLAACNLKDTRGRSLSVWVLAVALLLPYSNAHSGVVRFLCQDSQSSARWSFSVDFDNQVVRSDVPVNWTWITADEVLFAHAAFAGGRQYVTQLYTLNRRTGAFEMCDYGGDSEARAPCSQQYECRATSLTFDNAF